MGHNECSNGLKLSLDYRKSYCFNKAEYRATDKTNYFKNSTYTELIPLRQCIDYELKS
ncbi:hypothetical protein PTD2_12634 [Pseudoalteromonas tunicata D2]|uniref:Uncharacterized protein n=1 Tax=Pseudoalteromonas tunicata D2 TaxID=87626 RepID=A4C6R1_9GAMM|nr:hypothetical protein PTD2_12634 [Pseudoalteromonas tunicata D2]